MNLREQLIYRGVDTLEPLRFNYRVWSLSTWSISIFLGLITLGIYIKSGYSQSVWVSVGIISTITIIVMVVVTFRKKQQLYEKFDSWRDDVIEYIDNAACFKPNECLSQNSFDASGLNTQYYNRYSGSNYLRVENLEASYLLAQHEYTETYYETVTVTNSQGQIETRQEQRTRTKVDTIFEGLLLILHAPLPHSGWVIIRPKGIGVPKGSHKITVASPYLNNNYAIGVSEKFMGHRTLTPTLMESLWDYAQQFKYLPGYSYQKNLLYVTIPGGWLDFGRRPGVWSAITFSTLERVIQDCQNSIRFLKESAERLKPS